MLPAKDDNAQRERALDPFIEACAEMESPGLGLDRLDRLDFSRRDTTLDQMRIEAELEKMDIAGKAILHVGIGNSTLAARLESRVNRIDGVTLCPAEKAMADALKIRNYTVFLVNKYSGTFGLTIKRRYDIVVDNNLSNYACCRLHFHLMLDNYVRALKPNGQILTDQHGMDWIFEGHDRRLSYRDLCKLEAHFPLKLSKLTETVYSMRKVA
jgi:hypothetical protein